MVPPESFVHTSDALHRPIRSQTLREYGQYDQALYGGIADVKTVHFHML